VYNLADQMTSLNMPNTSTAETETRAYNSLFQLSELIQKAGSTTTLMDLQYYYTAGANNGKISKVIDTVSVETVTYQYDCLNRLISAAATNTKTGASIWGNSFTFDGFGNLTNKTVTAGSAPSLSQMVDGTTNRIAGYNYDANGNQTTIPVPGTGNVTPTYDIENRMIQLGTSGKYAYNHSNQRVWKKTTSEYFYFYGLDGKRAATYTVTVTGPSSGVAAVQLTASDMPVYYGSKLLMVGSYNGISFTAAYVGVDRLGSVPGGTKLYAWGEEVTQTANEKLKFATYWRDGESGVDYAMNRYYTSSYGRFTSPDPARSSAGPSDPGSWNRYAYVGGDPINLKDPGGLFAEGDGDGDGCFGNGMWISGCDISLFTGIQRFAPVTAFTKAANNLGAAAQAFQNRSHFSQNCQIDIAAIAAAAPSYIDPGSITIEALQAAAGLTSFVNGVGSTVSQATLYPNSPQAAKVVASLTIGAKFSNPNSLVTAVTVLGGSTIYIDPSRISGNLGTNEGLLMHELLHELGLSDDAIGAGLESIDPSIKPDAAGNWTNTKQFSTKLHKDCFTGKDNKN
jgi:RHS repeat-associated protein